jgi:hypothetical protein
MNTENDFRAANTKFPPRSGTAGVFTYPIISIFDSTRMTRICSVGEYRIQSGSPLSHLSKKTRENLKLIRTAR